MLDKKPLPKTPPYEPLTPPSQGGGKESLARGRIRAHNKYTHLEPPVKRDQHRLFNTPPLPPLRKGGDT